MMTKETRELILSKIERILKYNPDYVKLELEYSCVDSYPRLHYELRERVDKKLEDSRVKQLIKEVQDE